MQNNIMSANLKRCAKKLIKFLKLKTADARRFLKSVTRNIINALSEIALNIREGVVNVSTRIKESKLVKTLAQKRAPLGTKYRLLCAALSPTIVKGLVTAALAILETLRNG